MFSSNVEISYFRVGNLAKYILRVVELPSPFVFPKSILISNQLHGLGTMILAISDPRPNLHVSIRKIFQTLPSILM